MELKQGTIAWASVRMPNGESKRRPVVIATPTKLIPSLNQLRVVGISASFRPHDPNVIPLAYRDDGNIHTGLKKACAISLALVDDVDKASLRPSKYWVGKAALIEMLERL
jgi:hypothetical protein